jgi:hypothetical protein
MQGTGDYGGGPGADRATAGIRHFIEQAHSLAAYAPPRGAEGFIAARSCGTTERPIALVRRRAQALERQQGRDARSERG